MSVVEMSKIKLMGLTSYKEKILNALYKTGCVELSETEEFSDTFRVGFSKDVENLSAKYDALSRVIDFYTDIIEKSKKEPFYPKNYPLYKNFFVSYEDFIRSYEKENVVLEIVKETEKFYDEMASFKTERARINNINSLLEPYLPLSDKFSDFKDTAKTKVFFGTIKKEDSLNLSIGTENLTTAEINILTDGNLVVVLAVCHISESEELTAFLSENGFVPCQFDGDFTAEQMYNDNISELQKYSEREDEIRRLICERVSNLKYLKILYDYYGFMLERTKESESFSFTESTFILEGFVPTESIEKVKQALHLVSDAVFIEVSKPNKDEVVPTLLKNNFAVRQTEFITDMYSTPNYREKDPNKVVFFFFMLFMGVIMADIGYGFIMIAIGVFLASRIKVDNGTRRLWYNIAMGGVFAIIFGILFNSLFGVAILPFNILPSPVPSEGGQTGLMTILLGCLALGVLQIAVGYFMKAVNLFKSGDVVGGIFDGLCWVLFFIGFVFASFNFLVNYLMPDAFAKMNEDVKTFFSIMQMPGLIVTLGSLFFAAVTSGRKEKGFGKLTKGFGTVYGLINIFSDILSYARLFGLMLSGMIIAKTFNDIGIGLFANGAIGYVFGSVIILIGHAFNLAMGVLGAYIHDSRLQYIEFFGKFYTGEGSKFTPIGSNLKFVNVVK